MMPGCAFDQESAERYVSGRMPDDEQSAFEEHFFTCDACLSRVQDLQTLAQALAAARPAATRVSRVRFAWMGAIAASLLLTLTIWEARRVVGPPLVPSAVAPSVKPGALPPAAPAPESPALESPAPATPSQPLPTAGDRIAQMAAIVPPRYVSLPTRSAEDADAAAFSAAMSRYSAGRYADAARRLRAASANSPGSGHVQFFLGISELMIGNAPAARAALRRAAASGEQPYADESHFYLAKSALRAGNRQEAERELKIAVDLDAGPPGEAARLLKELPSFPR
jgi:tetratricopeptide (TPR) repeat protein